MLNGETTALYTATQAGNYYVKITLGPNNTYSDTVNVAVNSVPNSSITPSGTTVISQGGNVLLNTPSGSGYTFQWYLNGAMIPGETTFSYKPVQSGLYSVEVALDCGCNNVASQQVYVTVGLNEISAAPNITIGPNPIKNGNLNFSGIVEPINVSIINSVGVIADAAHLDHHNTRFTTDKLSPGIYSVRIENKNGTVIMVKKLIKE